MVVDFDLVLMVVAVFLNCHFCLRGNPYSRNKWREKKKNSGSGHTQFTIDHTANSYHSTWHVARCMLVVVLIGVDRDVGGWRIDPQRLLPPSAARYQRLPPATTYSICADDGK